MKRIVPTSILVITLLAVWYFYPCFTFKGTYERHWLGKTQYVVIGEDYSSGDFSTGYQPQPLRRMILVDMGASPIYPDGYPIKLGWNKIREHEPKGGNWITLKKKINTANQRVEPTAVTPVNPANTNRADTALP